VVVLLVRGQWDQVAGISRWKRTSSVWPALQLGQRIFHETRPQEPLGQRRATVQRPPEETWYKTAAV